MAHADCPFVWYELMTTDAPAARAFYQQVVGWQAADAGMPGMDYTLLSAGGQMVAGLMALPADAAAAGAPPGWVGYVGVQDVDATAAAVQAAGGALHHGPEDIPGVGRFAAVADPHGAGFCLFKGSTNEGESSPSAPDAMAPGQVGWHELMAGELATAWDFYSTLFGWTKDEAIDMGPMGTYQLFATGSGGAAGGMMAKPAEVPAAGWLYYFNVDALDAATDRLAQGGGQLINGPMQVPGGSWVAQCMDPQGAMFALVAPTR
jgi:predicted enzyme related to lactoylglutathione lyase